MRRWVLVAVGGMAGLVVAQAALALLSPTPVRTGPAREIQPAASGAWLGWAQNRPGHPNRFDVYVKDGANAPVKVNSLGVAFSGGFDGTVFAYQRIAPTARRLRGDSDIKLYNAATRARPALPDGVNTFNWEYSPSLSGQWLLFGRSNNDTDSILLHNLVTHERRRPDSRCCIDRAHPDPVRTAGRHLIPGQVNGDFAVWQGLNLTSYGLRTVSTVRRYQISTASRGIVPLPAGKWQYAPSVASDGTVFYVRSNDACVRTDGSACLLSSCGKGVVVREWAPNPDATDLALLAIPRGYDISKTYFDQSTSTLFYDRYNCTTGGSNIYKVAVS